MSHTHYFNGRPFARMTGHVKRYCKCGKAGPWVTVNGQQISEVPEKQGYQEDRLREMTKTDLTVLGQKEQIAHTWNSKTRKDQMIEDLMGVGR